MVIIKMILGGSKMVLEVFLFVFVLNSMTCEDSRKNSILDPTLAILIGLKNYYSLVVEIGSLACHFERS